MPFGHLDRAIPIPKTFLRRALLHHPASRPIHLNHRLGLPFAAHPSRFPLSTHQHPDPFNPSNSPDHPSHLRTMSDDAYSSFLDQANQDTGASKASTQSKSKGMSTKTVDTDVPAMLQKVEQYYTSEADEPFEPVSLKWGGKNMPSESTFYHMFRA